MAGRCGALVAGWLLVAMVNASSAQPLGWSSQRYYSTFLGHRHALRVVNMATGVSEAVFDAPTGVQLGNGALTPDGRFYLLPTSVGIARFRTDPPTFDRMIGSGVAVGSLAVSPVGTRAHAVGSFGRAVVNWETGAVLDVECCRQPSIFFTPDGAIRLHLEWPVGTPAETVMTAISDATGEVLWTTNEAGLLAHVAISGSSLAYTIGFEVVVRDVSDGTEQGRIPVLGYGLAWRGASLLVASKPDSRTNRLSAYDMPALLERVVAEEAVPDYENDANSVGVVVTGDSRYAYWLIFTSSLGISVSSTSYVVVDLDTSSVATRGGFGYQSQGDLALESAALCLFSLPSDVSAPVEGGLVGLPVVPEAHCRPWSVPEGTAAYRVVNPGPHVGPATLLVSVGANVLGGPWTLSEYILGHRVLITQASGVPGAPDLRAQVRDDRVTLSWVPTVGGGIQAFVVRGAVDGQPPTDVARITPSVREWTSPPLARGSYVAEVIAENGAGRSVPANPVRFSIGVMDPPEAPSNLTATVVDDRVALTWEPAASTPAPSGFIVEAAAVGSSSFVEVARSDGPPFVAMRVPVGAWQARVRALTAGGSSPASVPVTISTAPCSVPPGPPQSPWSVWTAGAWPVNPPSLTVRWAPPASGSVEHYVIEAGTASGLGNLGRLVVSGDRVSVTQAVTPPRAFVRVRARNACGESAPSSEVFIP